MGSASKALIAIVLACQWAAVGSGMAASAYPERAVRLVVGFPPAAVPMQSHASRNRPSKSNWGKRWSLKWPGCRRRDRDRIVAKAPPDDV